MGNLIIDYEKLSIVVITNTNKYKEHFNLLRFLVKDRLTRERFSDYHLNESRLEGKDFLIRFSTLESENFNRGWKCHFTLDLTESDKFKEVATPMTVIRRYLEGDYRV